MLTSLDIYLDTPLLAPPSAPAHAMLQNHIVLQLRIVPAQPVCLQEFLRYKIKRDSERGLVEVTVVGLDTDNIGLLPMSGPCLPFHLSTKAKTKINAARETKIDVP